MSLDYSAAHCISDAAEKYEVLLLEAESLASEHNKYAQSAGVDLIAVRKRVAGLAEVSESEDEKAQEK